MGERLERTEVAISRNCLFMLRERYGKRKSMKAVVELAAKEIAAAAAKDYLNQNGYSKADYCRKCGASLTFTDQQLRACTQCQEPIKGSSV